MPCPDCESVFEVLWKEGEEGHISENGERGGKELRDWKYVQLCQCLWW